MLEGISSASNSQRCMVTMHCKPINYQLYLSVNYQQHLSAISTGLSVSTWVTLTILQLTSGVFSTWSLQHMKSTLASLLPVVHDWLLQALELGKEIIVIFYDPCKAFVSVPHAPLLQKRSSTGLHQHNLVWSQSYLTHKSQRVVVSGESSPLLPVLKIFADDMLLYMQMHWHWLPEGCPIPSRR